VFDYDEDGFLDIFVADMFGRGQLYHNTVTARSPTSRPRHSAHTYGAVGCKVFDYDGDGRLDLFVVDMHSDMWTGLERASLTRSGHTKPASAVSLAVGPDRE